MPEDKNPESDDKSLDRIILVGHGWSFKGSSEGLLPEEEAQIQELAARYIKPIVGSDVYYVFHSSTKKGTDTSVIITNVLDYHFYGNWMEASELDPRGTVVREQQLEEILALIENHPYKERKLPEGFKFRGAILATHHTMIPPLASALGEKYGIDHDFSGFEIEEGHAVYLDLAAKTVEMLPPQP